MLTTAVANYNLVFNTELHSHPANKLPHPSEKTKVKNTQAMNNSNMNTSYILWRLNSLVPRPRAAFRRLQYGNAGRGLGTRLE